jgi:hypothetical protein
VRLPIAIHLILELLARLPELKQEGSHPARRIVTRDRDFSIQDHDSWRAGLLRPLLDREASFEVEREVEGCSVEDDFRQKLSLELVQLVGPSQ